MHLNLPTGLYQNGVPGSAPATSASLAAAGIGNAMLPRDLMASVAYQRTREMTIDELLLENRVVFLIGEINYSSAARAMMCGRCASRMEVMRGAYLGVLAWNTGTGVELTRCARRSPLVRQRRR